MDTLWVKEATKQGYAIAEEEEDSINLSYPDSDTRRGRVGKGVANTIMTTCNQGVYQNKKVRILTPLECWRLMGFDDSDEQAAKEVCSETQLYHQAGNSIVVNVLEAVLTNLLPDELHKEET